MRLIVVDYVDTNTGTISFWDIVEGNVLLA